MKREIVTFVSMEDMDLIDEVKKLNFYEIYFKFHKFGKII
jgi:hypothetical protein